MRKLLLFVFLLFALINRGFTQGGYPIFVTPTLTPPYSLKLSEYSKFGSQRMVVNIAVNDLNISNLPVKLHIKLETVGVTIETPATINTTPIYLDGGAVTILFGDDLTDYFNINNLIFKGYSKESYRRTGQLPEGFYKMTVEVLHYQTNRLISNSGTATAWITLGKPPVLKLPENNKVMGEFKGMPLTFSWLPCNLGNPVSAGSVQYKFEMWEMRVDGVSPYVVASTVPVFYEETTSNTLLSVYPATMLMEPGMKYAWRVTASDMNGFVPFEQDGHSEIRVFSYKSKCDSVTNFKADARGRSGLFGWQPRSNHTSYNVELRNPETGWLSASETFDNKVEFQDLEYGSTYEIRTQAVCDNDPSSLSDFTAWHRLEVPDQRTKPDSASCPNCGCDDNIIPKEIENLELNRNLKPGDTLVNRAGTTRFIVKTATQQGDGVYKGIFLFWAELWKVKFVCEYWDLSANTDNVILNMDFKSVYNPQFLLDVDVMTAYLDSLASAITTLTINTTISDTLTVNGSISTVYVNEGDSVIVVTVGENGELTEIVIGTNSDDLGHTLITGEDGEEYVVTGNGEVMGVDEFKNTGGNDRKIEEYKEEKESHLSATTVNFAASPTQKYGFDAYTEQKQALRNGYPALGNGYVPSYKSVASFATDKVVPSSFEKGITFRDEMGIPAVTTGGELTLRGRADGTVTSLYAYKAVTDTTEEVAGKLEVMSYDQQVKKLYIVPVNNAKLPDVTALQNVLNTVYAQAVTRWEVVPINESVPVIFPNGQMTHGGSSAIAVYNSDQNAIISKFKEKNNLESNALYLFFVDNVVGKTGDVAGYMPLQRQVGFIYDNPNLFVIAHELGHGAFNLRHTFSPENFIAAEHTTQNLMDYNGGTELWKHQWEFIRDPQSVWFAWAQDEKEGEFAEPVDDYFLLINNLSKTIGRELGSKDFVVVHRIKCEKIGDLSSVQSYAIKLPKNPELPSFLQDTKTITVYIKNLDTVKTDVVNVIIHFELNNNYIPKVEISSNIKSNVLDAPFLGIFYNNINRIIPITCNEQLNQLEIYKCSEPKDIATALNDDISCSSYITKLLSAIEECLKNRNEGKTGKIGDLFYAEKVAGLNSDNEKAELRKIADYFNLISDLLFKDCNTEVYNEVGGYFKYNYDQFKLKNKPFEDYLSRLESFVREFENKKDLLSKFSDRETITFLVTIFSDDELSYLPIDLRTKCLSILASKELRGALFDKEKSTEGLVIRLVKNVQWSDVGVLLDSLKQGILLNTIDQGYNDLYDDDNYKEFVEILDDYILKKNNVVGDNVGNIIFETNEKDLFFNLTGDNGKKYISASKVIKAGELNLNVSRITGYKLVQHGSGENMQWVVEPQIETYAKSTSFDNVVTVYHNSATKGVDVDKLGQFEVVSALKLHYYVQSNRNEEIKSTIYATAESVTLLVGVGEITMAKKGLSLFFGICNTVSSFSALSANVGHDYIITNYGEAGKEFIDALDLISAISGSVDLGVTGTLKIREIIKGDIGKISKFLASNNGLKLKAAENTKDIAIQAERLVELYGDIDKVEDFITGPLRTKIFSTLSESQAEQLISELRVNLGLRTALEDKKYLVDSWKRVFNAADNGAPILRKDIDVLTSLSKFDDNLINKIGSDKFDNFLKNLIKAYPNCKTCGGKGDALVGNMNDVLDDLHNIVISQGKVLKADGSFVDGFDAFMIEAGEQASKAKAAALTLRKMSRNWKELTEGGWTLKSMEGKIPDIETGHRFDLQFVRTVDGLPQTKSVEMKNWSAARSIPADESSQFYAHIASKKQFEYYFSDAARAGMKEKFQDIFKDATRAQKLWDANPTFFENLGFPDVDALVDAANKGKLLDHSILNFVK